MTLKMAFVKLDTKILDSTLWIEPPSRTVFITALLMATPAEFPMPQREIATRTLDLTGYEVPPGWYGFVPAAGSGIIRRAMVDMEEGYQALERLATPEPESRSKDFEGRRMIRVDGGFIILNFMKYRDRDTTAAERQRRLRERKKSNAVTVGHHAVTLCDITHTEYRVQSTETDKEETTLAPSDKEPSLKAEPLGFFPCVGKGEKRWSFHQKQVDEWKEAYPGIDVLAELRKAKQWLIANPERNKTCRGMPKFVNGWLSRAQDKGGSNGIASTARPTAADLRNQKQAEELRKFRELADA